MAMTDKDIVEYMERTGLSAWQRYRDRWYLIIADRLEAEQRKALNNLSGQRGNGWKSLRSAIKAAAKIVPMPAAAD